MGTTTKPKTGVTELKPLFTKKGVMGTKKNPKERVVITFEQLFYRDGVAMYRVSNDGQVYYQIFKLRYLEISDGSFTALYPDDRDFACGNATNAFDLYSAHEKIKVFVKGLERFK